MPSCSNGSQPTRRNHRSHKERTDLTGESMDTPKQAAEQIGVSNQTSYRWIERIAREGNYTGKATPTLVSA